MRRVGRLLQHNCLRNASHLREHLLKIEWQDSVRLCEYILEATLKVWIIIWIPLYWSRETSVRLLGQTASQFLCFLVWEIVEQQCLCVIFLERDQASDFLNQTSDTFELQHSLEAMMALGLH
jgi:hypothetical protein